MPLTRDETELVKAGVEGALAPVRELVFRAFGPLADQLGDILGDYGRQFRTAQLLKILDKTKRMADQAGVEVNVIPPRILLPTVHFASLEDEETLQEKWAALLANASAEPDRIPASFPDILHSLSPAEVRFLDQALENVAGGDVKIAEAADREMPQFSVGIKADLPIDERILQSADELMLDNLQRLGLIRFVGGSSVAVGSQVIGDSDKYVIPAFGKAFIRACRPPDR